MRIILVIVCTGAVLASCKSGNNSANVRSISAVNDSSTIPKDSNTFYFPLGATSGDAHVLDTFTNSWYSKMLFGLHEPVLYQSSDTSEIFRFIWLRTFHKPIAIRVTAKKGEHILTVKVASGAGGYDVGNLVRDTSFYISNNEWKEFSSQIGAINFWSLPSQDNNRGKDGSEWILEGQETGKYHFVTRWSPRANVTSNKDYRSCCYYLIQLSGLNIPDKELY
jgi:hypothetical protein